MKSSGGREFKSCPGHFKYVNILFNKMPNLIGENMITFVSFIFQIIASFFILICLDLFLWAYAIDEIIKKY